MPSEHTMKVAEKLYNEGYISYPRTETTFFKEGTDLKGILGNFLPSQQFGAYTDKLLNQGHYCHPRRVRHRVLSSFDLFHLSTASEPS